MPVSTLSPPIAAGGASDAAIEAVFEVMVPLARVAIDHGLQFGRLEELLKRAMIEAARGASIEERASPTPVSRLSLITGIHRQEVKRLVGQGPVVRTRTERTRVCELFVRWTTDPDWQDEHGRPLILPRRFDRIDQPCFEKLARSVTKDVHPRTLLDELTRLDMVAIDPASDTVQLRQQDFVPTGEVADLLAFLGANIGDHLSAAQVNIAASLRRRSDPDASPPFLEQSLYADELSAASAIDGARHATAAWRETARALAPRLQSLEDADRAAGRASTHRIRIGMYCYTAPLQEGRDSPSPRGSGSKE